MISTSLVLSPPRSYTTTVWRVYYWIAEALQCLLWDGLNCVQVLVASLSPCLPETQEKKGVAISNHPQIRIPPIPPAHLMHSKIESLSPEYASDDDDDDDDEEEGEEEEEEEEEGEEEEEAALGNKGRCILPHSCHHY